MARGKARTSVFARARKSPPIFSSETSRADGVLRMQGAAYQRSKQRSQCQHSIPLPCHAMPTAGWPASHSSSRFLLPSLSTRPASSLSLTSFQLLFPRDLQRTSDLLSFWVASLGDDLCSIVTTLLRGQSRGVSIPRASARTHPRAYAVQFFRLG